MTPLMARVTSATRGAGAARVQALAHRVLQYGEFLADHRPRLADDGGAADLRELAAVARRELGENNVADVEHALAGGANGEIVLRRAHQQEIVLGAEFLHEAIELGGKLELADAGPRVFKEPLVAALGDPGRALRGRKFLRRAQPREIARQFIGGLRQCAERRRDAIDQRRAEQGQPNRNGPRQIQAMRPDHALERARRDRRCRWCGRSMTPRRRAPRPRPASRSRSRRRRGRARRRFRRSGARPRKHRRRWTPENY